MDVTEVAVEIGETRNHPFEYGNYRASVRLTAVVEEGEDHRDVARDLRGTARLQAVQECDEWEEQVREEHRVAGVVVDLERSISWLAKVARTVGEARLQWDDARRQVVELPEDMRIAWLDKLNTAFDKRCEEIAAAEIETYDDDEIVDSIEPSPWEEE